MIFFFADTFFVKENDFIKSKKFFNNIFSQYPLMVCNILNIKNNCLTNLLRIKQSENHYFYN